MATNKTNDQKFKEDVLESKEQLSQIATTDWVIIEGNRGGSNVAAAITNAAFTLPEASTYFKS